MIRLRSVFALVALTLAALVATPTDVAQAGHGCCTPPPPVAVTLCVQAPCDPCAHSVTVCVPVCCTETPTVCWRKGLFGRQVATYTWPCCGHSVKVVVTRRGDVKVRG